ncbi:MAG TPA: FAD-binding protein [Rhizomicrobium sp.]
MTGILANAEADVIEAVRAARESRRTLEIVGGGTKRAYGRAAPCDDVLDVSRLSGVVNYEPEELVLTVKSGTPVAEIDALLGSKSQCLGFEPADWGPLLDAPARASTIAGVLSADANGPAAVRYGRARDSLLGYRAVNGLAEAYKAGGRVVKNVTGFDLPKLMCGAFGTLGVLTEVTLRVFPKPSDAAVLIVRDISAAEGLTLLRTIWSSPLEATGLCYVPAAATSAALGEIQKGAALIRLEGAPEPLREKIEGAKALLGERAQTLGIEIFSRIGDGAIFLGRDLDVWRVFVPPAEAAKLVAAIQSPLWFADWAGGLLWIGMLPGNDGARLRHIIEPVGGHTTLLRAATETRGRVDVFQPETPARGALTRSVKAAFDPLGLFNPGRMWREEKEAV